MSNDVSSFPDRLSSKKIVLARMQFTNGKNVADDVPYDFPHIIIIYIFQGPSHHILWVCIFFAIRQNLNIFF